MSLNTVKAILILNAKKGWSPEARAKAALTRKRKKKAPKPGSYAHTKSLTEKAYKGLKPEAKAAKVGVRRKTGSKDMNSVKPIDILKRNPGKSLLQKEGTAHIASLGLKTQVKEHMGQIIKVGADHATTQKALTKAGYKLTDSAKEGKGRLGDSGSQVSEYVGKGHTIHIQTYQGNKTSGARIYKHVKKGYGK
jgi:hypothetical protein